MEVTVRSRNFCKAALGSLLFSATAWSAADLKVRHIGTAALNKAVPFSMGLEISNTGDQTFTGPVGLKPFIIPDADFSKTVGFKPIQFDTMVAFVNIAPGKSQVVTYHTPDLPLIPKASYLLGATVIPRALNTREIENNITHELLPMGSFSHAGPSPLETTIDLYSDIRSEISPSGGEADHAWRVFWRGERRYDDLRTLFFIYSAKEKKIYTSDYEKDAAWVPMGEDYDELGREVEYDVYHQGPTFETVAPGELFLLTFINYTERAFELYHANNIDARKFQASYLTPKPSFELWKTITDEGPLAFTETLQLNSSYDAQKTWSLETGSIPETITPSGRTGQTDSSQEFRLQASELALEIGTQRFAGVFSVKQEDSTIEEKPLNLVLSRFLAADVPVLDALDSVAVSSVSPAAPAPVSYAILNTGKSPLPFKLQTNNDWIFFSETEGVVAPGETKSIEITFSPIGKPIGNNRGSFIIHNASLVNAKTVQVIYSDTAP